MRLRLLLLLLSLSTACAAPPAPVSAPRPAPQAPTFARAEETKPCVFSGSYLPMGVAELFADATATAPIAMLTDRIQVAELTLPADAAGRYRVVLHAPVRATVWMNGSVRALELPARVDLVGDHVWFPTGAAASAVQAPNRRALVTASIGRSRDSMSRMSSGQNGLDADIEPGSRFTPSSASRVEACDALRLTGSTPPSADEEGPRALAGDWVAVYADAARGQSLGSVRYYRNVTVLEERDGVARIRGGTHFFGFDVWVASSDLLANAREKRTVGTIVAFEGKHDRRRVTTDTPLRVGPDGAATPLIVGPEAELVVVEVRGGYARVVVPGITPAGPERQFLVEASALAPDTK
jgi:hypothetical protein